MARQNPAEAAEKWARRLSAATEDIRAGVERVSEAPGVAAARKRTKWEAGLRESGDKWERNVRNVSLEEWKAKTLDVGLSRVAQGAQANQGKTQQFFEEFLPHLDRGVSQVTAMPDTTMEDRINRAVAMMRHNSNFKRGQGS